MVFEEARDLLLGRLSRFSASDPLGQYVLSEMRAAQTRLENRPLLPWFLLQKHTENLKIGQYNYQRPSGFIRFHETDYMELRQNGEVVNLIQSVPGHSAQKQFYQFPDQMPQAVELRNTFIRVWPTPQEEYELKFSFYGRDSLIQPDTENDWLDYFPELLIAETGYIMATVYTQHREAAQLMQTMLQRELLEYRRSVIARQEAGMQSTPED